MGFHSKMYTRKCSDIDIITKQMLVDLCKYVADRQAFMLPTEPPWLHFILYIYIVTKLRNISFTISYRVPFYLIKYQPSRDKNLQREPI